MSVAETSRSRTLAVEGEAHIGHYDPDMGYGTGWSTVSQ
jgi:hypothetical protein